MSSNTPCAVYNFYNCCGSAGAASSSQSGQFIWQSGNLLDPAGGPQVTQEPLTPGFTFGNVPDANLKAYLGLLPLHRKAQLQDIALLKFPNTGTYTSTISFDLVVLDYNGVVIRQISTAPLNYVNIPLKTWTPIALSSVAGDLDIPAGQLVAGQLTFGAPLPPAAFFFAVYQLSATGILM